MTAPRLVLIDGNACVYRAFFALPALTNSKGTPTNAVLGFATMLLKFIREEQPQSLAVAFDGPGPTSRHREFAEYKAQRPPMPDNLSAQIPLVDRLLDCLRVPRLLIPGEEADDILAALALCASTDGYEVRIITSDKDLLQVVDDRVVVRDPLMPRTLGPVEVVAKFGIAPTQIPDLLALMGDSSDNIPGVPGIGEKTARDLLQRFGNLDQILERLGEITKPKLRETLTAYAEQARMSKRLATVRRDLALPCRLADLSCSEPDLNQLLPFLRELEFTRLIRQFEQPTLGMTGNDQ